MRNETFEPEAISGPGRISTVTSAGFTILMPFDRPSSSATLGEFRGVPGKAATSPDGGAGTAGVAVLGAGDAGWGAGSAGVNVADGGVAVADGGVNVVDGAGGGGVAGAAAAGADGSTA